MTTWAEHDSIVSTIERRWGIGRLPALVSPELAARFAHAQAINRGEAPLWDGATLADVPGMLTRAWQALEAEAFARNHAPYGGPVFTVQADEPERGVIEVAHDEEHRRALALRAKHEGRTIETWTVAEVARVLKASSCIATIKGAWPDATVTGMAPKRPKPPPLPADDLDDVFGVRGEVA